MSTQLEAGGADKEGPCALDPEVPQRIGAFLEAYDVSFPDEALIAVAWTDGLSDGPRVYLSRPDLGQLLERDADARRDGEKLAKICAGYRSEIGDLQARDVQLEAELAEAREAAGRLVANIELWVGFPAVRSLDPAEFPAWLTESARAVGPGAITARGAAQAPAAAPEIKE